MPALQNQKWELFCQGLAKGQNGDAAYEAAGYRPNRHNASRLKTTETIIARVQELQGKIANRLILSKQYVVDAALENLEKSLGRRPVKITKRVKVDDEYVNEVTDVFVYEGQVANVALKMLGSEFSLFTERKDVRITNEYSNMTDEQLAQRLVEVGQQMLAGPVIEHDEDETQE